MICEFVMEPGAQLLWKLHGFVYSLAEFSPPLRPINPLHSAVVLPYVTALVFVFQGVISITITENSINPNSHNIPL